MKSSPLALTDISELTRLEARTRLGKNTSGRVLAVENGGGGAALEVLSQLSKRETLSDVA
jgi:hypothetical protein